MVDQAELNLKKKNNVKTTVLSFNGRVFDNVFCVPYLLQKFQTQSHRIQIGGSTTNVKSIRIGNLDFQDLKMIMGPGSLNDLAKLFLGEKKDGLDIRKFQTRELFDEHREEIVKYCRQDVALLHPLYRDFI